MDIISVVSILGWAGAVIGLVAYFLLSVNKMSGTSLQYQTLNITSAILVFTNSFYHGAYPSAMVNVVWVFIALFSIYYFSGQQTKRMK